MKNWAITATTQFAYLLSFWTGVRYDVDLIKWTITDEDLGTTVEYQIQLNENLGRQEGVGDEIATIAPYISWIGASYAEPFALMAYHSALGSLNTRDQLFHLYKVLEILEEKFGGEGRFVSFLKQRGISRNLYKRAKRIINKRSYFIRHSPKPGERIRPIPESEIDICWEITRRVLRACIELEHQERVGDSPSSDNSDNSEPNR